MDINEALSELNDFFDDGPCNIHFEAWDTIRKTLVEALKHSHNKQSTPCKRCSGAASMFGVGCYCPWCGRKIE